MALYGIYSNKQAPLTGVFMYSTPTGATVLVTEVSSERGCPSTLFDDKKDCGEVVSFVKRVKKPDVVYKELR